MQTEYWTRRDGTRILLQEMELSHIKATIAMLDRQAPRIAMRHGLRLMSAALCTAPTVIGVDEHGRDIEGPSVSLGPSGDLAQNAFDRELDELRTHPHHWLHTLPLVRKLEQLIRDHPQTPNSHAPGSPDWEIWEDKRQHIG
jgi:hypothetical protein